MGGALLELRLRGGFAPRDERFVLDSDGQALFTSRGCAPRTLQPSEAEVDEITRELDAAGWDDLPAEFDAQGWDMHDVTITYRRRTIRFLRGAIWCGLAGDHVARAQRLIYEIVFRDLRNDSAPSS